MKVLIHDLDETQFRNLLPEPDANITVVSHKNEIHNCIGCFGCWIKTPGTCIIKDSWKELGTLFARCDDLIVISRCFYGGYSPFVKNVWDRSIGYILPYFTIKNGEMHHKNRYKEQIKLSVYFYGDDITEAEKDTARQLAQANAINFYAGVKSVRFYTDAQQIAGELV